MCNQSPHFLARELIIGTGDFQSIEGFADRLLGMSFLGGLKYTIDFETQTIKWHPAIETAEFGEF